MWLSRFSMGEPEYPASIIRPPGVGRPSSPVAAIKWDTLFASRDSCLHGPTDCPFRPLTRMVSQFRSRQNYDSYYRERAGNVASGNASRKLGYTIERLLYISRPQIVRTLFGWVSHDTTIRRTSRSRLPPHSACGLRAIQPERMVALRSGIL